MAKQYLGKPMTDLFQTIKTAITEADNQNELALKIGRDKSVYAKHRLQSLDWLPTDGGEYDREAERLIRDIIDDLRSSGDNDDLAHYAAQMLEDRLEWRTNEMYWTTKHNYDN